MLKLVIDALMLPLRHIGAVAKIFWPYPAFAVLLFVVGLFMPSTRYHVEAPGAAIALVVVVCSFLVFARCAVSWHRHIVLGGAARITLSLPDMASVRYLAWSLLNIILMLVVAAVCAGIWSLIVKTAGDAFDPRNWEFVRMKIALAFFAAAIVSIHFYLFGEVTLRLPRTAVASNDVTSAVPLRWFGIRDGRAAAAVLLLFGLFQLLQIATLLLVMWGGTAGLWIMLLARPVIAIWFGIAGITLLSLMYAQAAEGRRLVPA